MSDYLAHIAEDRTQTVQAHLTGTAELSARFAAAFGAEPQGRLLGLAHDIGKRSAAFQERLCGGRVVDHATAGAWECAKQNAIWAAACIAGHHGGLPDMGNEKLDTPDVSTVRGRLKRAERGDIPAYEPLPLPRTAPPEGYGQDALTDSFFIRMLYSCLVDADYLDTERFMSGGAAERGTGEPLRVLLDKLERHIAEQGWLTPSGDLNRRRSETLRACLDGGARDKGLFTLTVPTGGGKTVASMAFALRHAMRHGMERVIYVIPYTSIIEQTADVFREIFGAENVLEHHAGVSYEVKERGDAAQYRLVRATENWDAPIVVTTAVQFFDSLYANRPSKCRKLHSIANSVLIFDEAQMLPTEHLRPCVAAIAKLVTNFGASAVLCTATQPVLNDLFREYAPQLATTELCPDVSGLFAQFRRVTFADAGKLGVDTLAEKLAALPQVLCIVNSRRAAQEVYAKLPEEGGYHLSTLMCPAHRREVLAEIRRRLGEGLPCRVVS
ncbi:MAG: CRISPR-associated endonuclease Cas3'', partial [Oscillospiraceae bacterium]|nr:CRISPR-associated endonuclease Cas3'' [Oscillospiraceae bacterium]